MIPKHAPEDQILLVTWRSIIGMAGPMSEQYRWILTGIGASLALIVANLESLRAVVCGEHLKWSLVLLVAALLLASVAYMLSEAVKMRSDVTNHLEGVLNTPEAEKVLGAIKMEPKELFAEVAKPFFGPLGWLMRRGAEKGAADPFSTEKGSIGMIVWQAYVMWASLLAAASGIIVLVVGIK